MSMNMRPPMTFVQRMLMTLVRLKLANREDSHFEKSKVLIDLIAEKNPILLDVLKMALNDRHEIEFVEWAEKTALYVPNDTTDNFWDKGNWQSNDWENALQIVTASQYASEMTRFVAAEKLIELRRRFGYVYLLGSATGLYKIGRSVNPENRIHQFSPALPFEVELVHEIPADDYFNAEAALHKQYSDKRSNGEWFELSDSDVHAIKRLIGYINGEFIVEEQDNEQLG